MAMTWSLSDGDFRDLQISRGTFLKVVGAEEVRQRILTTLQHYWQEYFLNVPAGVPWYELILGQKDKRLVEVLLRRAVLGVPGVVSILDFSLTQNSFRAYTATMSVEVSNGERRYSVIKQKIAITSEGTVDTGIKFAAFDWNFAAEGPV